MTLDQIKSFIIESNKIEAIVRDATQQEIEEFQRFMALPFITIEELEKFLSVYEPDALLRDKYCMDVRVGKYLPPFGGPEIRSELRRILETPLSAYEKHCAYEQLHPFTDGNGRSGRMLWAWQMKDLSLGFLHRFYYQALEYEK